MHAVFRVPNSREKRASPERKFFFSAKYLNSVEATIGDWIVWSLPKRPGISDKGVYIAVAKVDAVSSDPEKRGSCFASLSGFQKLDPPLQAIGPEATYESAMAEPGYKSPAHQVRPLPDQEFVNILEDYLSEAASQGHFDVTQDSYEERMQRTELFRKIVADARIRIRSGFPQLR